MQVPLQIVFRGFQRSQALEHAIRERADKLEEFHPRITSCRVTVEELGRHQHQGRQFQVGVDVRVPGHEFVSNRDHHEDVYVALRNAFDAVKRQLEDIARLARGDVKTHPLSRHGRITRLFTDEGYGFIETPDGRELYFGRENIVHPGFEDLEPGLEVQFIEESGGEGPQAKRVSVGKHRA